MDQCHLADLCRHVANFGARENWAFKARPTIAWEFATIADFADAEYALHRTILAMCPYLNTAQIKRVPTPFCTEFDCYGVTFRLTCTQVIATPQGPVGAAEAEWEHPSPGFLAKLAQFRKRAGY